MEVKNQSAKQVPENERIRSSETGEHKGEKLLNPTTVNPVTTGSIGHDDYIKKWLRSLEILHHGHWDASRYYDGINLGLGIATTVTATISGTTAFAQIQQQVEQVELNTMIQVGIGIFALIAAALGAVQSFVRPSELASRHKQAAQKYGTLRREIELQLQLGLPIEHEFLTDFRLRWGAVDEETLPVPQRIYDRTEKEYPKP